MSTRSYAMRYRQRGQSRFSTMLGLPMNGAGQTASTTTSNNTKPPVNLQAQDGVEYTSVHVTWDKGTSDIPDSQLRYRVYKNNTLVYTTTSDGQRSWTDTGLNPGEYHTYKVRSLFTHPPIRNRMTWESPSMLATRAL
jgi:hypothetical protein